MRMKPSLPAGPSSRKDTSAGEEPPARWSIANGLSRVSSHCAGMEEVRKKKDKNGKVPGQGGLRGGPEGYRRRFYRRNNKSRST